MIKKIIEIPKVSVIMPVYNADLYLKVAITSILNQTLQNFELIIVDDGSTDASIKIIESFKDSRIIIIKQKNSGAAAARNVAIKAALSEYIAILDADDIAMPERLEKQGNFLDKNPEYIIVGSNADVIDKNGDYIFSSSQKLNDEEIRNILPRMPFYHPSIMYRKKQFFVAGEYPEYMVTAQDRILINKMAPIGKMANLPDFLIKYRIVPTANTVRNYKKAKRRDKIVSKAIEYNNISDDDKDYLNSLLKNRNSKKRLVDYHHYIARKYLWNNNQPRLVRKNTLILLKMNPLSFSSVIMFLCSFLTKRQISYMYVRISNNASHLSS